MTLRRAADGVLVEVEAELAGAAAGGRRVGRHVEDGGAGLDGSFGELTGMCLEGFTRVRTSTRAGVRFEAFGARQGGDGGRQLAERRRAQFLDRDHLDDSRSTERPPRMARGAAGGQDVIGAGGIIAGGLRAVRADEHAAGVADAGEQRRRREC